VGLSESSNRTSVPRRLHPGRLLVPAGVKLGLGRIGFHTFRHTYRAWLDETGAPMGVQKKLDATPHISTTMDQYGNASAVEKRKANRPIVERVLGREMNQQLSIQ
jgi:integrase